MPRPYDFEFVAFAPSAGDPEITKQAFSLINANVWGLEATDQARTVDGYAVQLVAAVSPAGEVVAAGTMEMHPPDFFYITEITTDQNYRREHKLGSRIMTILEDTARDLGGQEIALSALPMSRAFFEKCGYRADLSPYISSLGMVKKIGSRSDNSAE